MSGLQVATRAVIFGRVQGVGFRYECMRAAQHMREAHDLTGWVRNLNSGEVEVFVQGSRQAVDALLNWCRRGPSRAEIVRVEEEQVDPDPSIRDFEIR